ncbi:hypothetical protein G7A66_10125 [Altererythrobacter sp. SALINAS58]|uniref:hypothetical protein n=1 Tax=Alteripontixanthobacter muriae TaxID=2705546 RepID=UPI0019D6357C|nr:hypothetical protein [Alteripontixanthobacter muriae]NTZ43429.1 hypothetical protein [Alteripontixanthobacter muriae]
MKPLIIFVAASAGRDVFAERYALLISALASLFVLTGGQTHIDYYKRRFGANTLAIRHHYERYFGDSIIQFIAVLPFVALLAWAWTPETSLIALIVVLVGIEKFFDEDQRHFLFTKQYGRWSLNFGARVIVPSLIILPAIWLVTEPLILIYAGGSAVSFVLYLFVRRRHTRFHVRLFRRHLASITSQGRMVFKRFWVRWRSEYAFNQAWTFTSINIYLIDRFWVANASDLRLDVYVFFDSILKVAVVGHSLFYFTPRRPHLIKAETQPAAELLRIPNLALPALLCLGGVAIATGFTELMPDYRWIPFTMLAGMGFFYFLQAASLVMVEAVFWRASRRKLLTIDILSMALIFCLYLLLRPDLWAVPWIASIGVAARIAFYLFVSRTDMLSDRGCKSAS